MKVIKPSHEITSYTPDMEKQIELAGRVCWKSEDKICEGSEVKFIEMIKNVNHASVLEHSSMSVHFITDRGILAELTRHRMASFSVESTRYCNYSKEKYGQEIAVIDPRGAFWNTGSLADSMKYDLWEVSMRTAEREYFALLSIGATAQEARDVLPNSLKTEIRMTANIREWRHIFTLRCAKAAHPQMRELMIPLLEECKTRWSVLFDDITC